MNPTQDRSTNRRLIEAANIAYHEAEAELYDASHPEILWCERVHWEAFARRYLAPSHASCRVLDIGAGTGFIGGVFRPYLTAADHFVATDLSPDMLEVMRRNLTPFTAQLEIRVASADHIPFEDGSFDIVVINSALHHFPDVDGCLREAARVVKPGGLLAIMHEPNIRFSRSWFSRQVARTTSVLASRVDAPSKHTPRPDYTPVFAHVNQRLLDQGLIEQALPQREIQALVDVHSPTARGRYEPVGFDPPIWMNGPFKGWTLELLQTYNHLGKLDPTGAEWRMILEKTFSMIRPGSGSLFSFVAKKNI